MLQGLDANLHFNQPNLAHYNQTISQPTNTIGWATKAGDYSYKRSRRVKFNSSVVQHVILIPTVEEYRSAGLNEHLWWCNIDYKNFKECAVKELQRFLLENTRSDTKSALKMLYQPESNESTSPSLETVHQCPVSLSCRSLKSIVAAPSASAPLISIDAGAHHLATTTASTSTTTTVSNHSNDLPLNILSNKENSIIINKKSEQLENLNSKFTVFSAAASSGTITKLSAVSSQMAPLTSSNNTAFTAVATLIC